MTLETWSAYVLTVLVMMSTPGPSQLLILSNSMENGFRRASFTMMGDLTANFFQMLAAGLGLTVIIASSVNALTTIKWLGVAYLIWIGVQMIRKGKAGDFEVGDANTLTPLSSLWLQGFMTSAANPKAVVFFAALFPQFILAEAPFWPQFAILSATYIAMDASFLATYGLGADWIGKRIHGPHRIWIDRVGGAFIIGAAALLALQSASQ